MTAIPKIIPSRNGACRIDSLAIAVWSARLRVSSMMIEKISVVAPTTAVPISTGLAVALNVFPAPSFSSSRFLAWAKSGSTPYVRRPRPPRRAASRSATARTRSGVVVTGP
jgi:hypothetical protein